MTDRDAFKDRGRGLEEEYFHRKEQELIAKMRERAEAETARQAIGEKTGVADAQLLQDLQELGYTAGTVALLHVVPLVQMAWAEGRVSMRERDLIIEAARARGIESGSAADQQLAGWLATRPSDELFSTTLRAIGAMLESRPPEEREAGRKDLVSYLTSIASASGGVLGWGAVSDAERALLTRITAELEQTHKSADILPKP
ncbi:MAG TPA: hypothetical protein VMN81_04425 [Vicinamibacterales bacterium]|nr:hypothetical protein [Vicinamibacterales bacterium]